MTMYIVTVKLNKDPEHDPRNKKTGVCPVSPECTDVTGEHHSLLVESELQLKVVRETFPHITRIEEVSPP